MMRRKAPSQPRRGTRMSALYDLRQEHAANGLIAGISRFWVLLAHRNFCLARETAVPPQMRKRDAPPQSPAMPKKFVSAANCAVARILANPGICGGIRNGQKTRYVIYVRYLVRGGGSGIRTHDTVSRIHAFQASAFSHSAIPPGTVRRAQYSDAPGRDNPHLPDWARRQPARAARSIDRAHVARLAHVIAREFGGAVAECRACG